MEKQNNNAKNINEVLATIKTELAACNLEKTGDNKFAGFKYFQLPDFLPELTKLIHKHGANDVFSVEEENGRMWAILHFYYGGEEICTKLPFEVYPSTTMKSQSMMQVVGSEITYYRRYLYMSLFNIVEDDTFDKLDNTGKGNQTIQTKQATPKESTIKLTKKQADYLVNEIGYKGDTSNLTVQDARKIRDELEQKKTEAQPEPASERQKAQLQKYIEEKKWNGDPNTLTFQEASDIIQSIIFKGQKDE